MGGGAHAEEERKGSRQNTKREMSGLCEDPALKTVEDGWGGKTAEALDLGLRPLSWR